MVAGVCVVNNSFLWEKEWMGVYSHSQFCGGTA